MIHLNIMEDRDAWLEARGNRIGGSDAACIVGKNPWRSNVQLFREKAGLEAPKDVSNDKAVEYGRKAEPLLRDLFSLDHPELAVCYEDNNIWTNDDMDFAHASLDGWFMDGDEVAGILEIKTATIQNAKQNAQWYKRIPDHYYCQVLWYMMVTGARFAWVQALLRWEYHNGTVTEHIQQYKIDRYPRVETDIRILMQEAERFWKRIVTKEQPPLILPSI